MIILQAENLHKHYTEERVAIAGVSLAVHSGEVLALIGQSGSGKTTLLRLLGGLLDPDQGEVLFHGEKLEGPKTKLVPGHEQIRLVHQDFKLHHRMTVAENLKNALLGYQLDYQKERTEELIIRCGLTKVRTQFVHELSGGEKQRTAIAMALATEPEVLLLDEPFSNLDLQTKNELLQLVRTIADELQTAIVLVTHDTRDGLEIADRVAVLRAGRLLKTGRPRELYQQPGLDYIAGLFGIYNQLNREEIKRWLPAFSLPGEQFGLWPEKIHLSLSSTPNATIVETRFLGAYQRLTIKLDWGLVLYASSTGDVFHKGGLVSAQAKGTNFFKLQEI